MQKVALIGYSGHAFVVADTIKAMGLKLLGYYETSPKNKNPFGLAYLGQEGESKSLDMLYSENNFFFVSIGLNSLRASITEMLFKMGLQTLIVRHPLSFVSDYATLQSGTLIAPGCKVNALVQIGKGVILNTGSIIEHECTIGNYVHVAPGAVLAGNVTVGENSFIGANAVIKEGVTIGRNVVIGAGTVILTDIRDGEKWAGNPGKLIKKNVQ